jgi:uncharacterized repeat protein (TIGR01451 family)
MKAQHQHSSNSSDFKPKPRVFITRGSLTYYTHSSFTRKIAATIGAAFMVGTALLGFAEAAPKRVDWCNTIWSADNAGTTGNLVSWINPLTGATASTPGPTSQITMPPTFPATGSVAALGIHAESGTLFAFDRSGATGTLYKYKFGTNTTWQTVSLTGLLGLSGTQTVVGASNNLNKMTVDGNTLLIAESVGLVVYAIPLNSSGTVTGNAVPTTYSYVGDPSGTPPHTAVSFHHNLGGGDPLPTDPIGSVIMNGGDITTDEYGDVYNVTYNSVLTAWNLIGSTWTPTIVTTKAYFYLQDPTAKTWTYQGETAATVNFAGAAFYKGELFVKAATQLKKVPLVRSGSTYTGWNSALINVGSVSTGFSSADLAACGTPVITVGKTQQVYTDAAATIPSSDQVNVKTDQYIKYTIIAKNTGSTWARSSVIADILPAGTSYVANSATLNTINLNQASYPSAGFSVNSISAAAGLIKFAPDPDTATLTFVVQVTATTGSVQNRATIAYVDGSGLASETPDCVAVPKVNCAETSSLPLYPSASGTVWQDKNGSITIDSSPLESGTDAGGLTVYAVNSSGIVVGKAAVSALDGTYTIANLPTTAATYTLRLSTDSSVNLGGTAPTTSSLPSGWVNTGENKNGVTETITPGDIAISITGAGTSLVNQNFGIEQPPTTNTLTSASVTNTTVNAPLSSTPLAGSDTDGTVAFFKIINLPLLTQGVLNWDNDNNSATPPVALLAGQTIPAASADKLFFSPVAGFVGNASFTYAAVDNATVVSPNPGTYTIPVIASNTGTIDGTVWADLNRNNLLDNSELGTTAGSSSLTVYLVDSSNVVIAKTTVLPDGTFSFSGLASGTYTLILSNDSSILVGAAPPVPSLPSGWDTTGENSGNPASGTSDGTPDGKITVTIP